MVAYWLVVVVLVVIVGVLSLMVDIRGDMLISPPEFSKCGGGVLSKTLIKKEIGGYLFVFNIIFLP